MSFTRDLLSGLAELLAAGGAGTWRSSGVYAAGETGIVIGAVPPKPDRLVVLTDYQVSDSPYLNDSTVGIQVRTRGGTDPREVSDLDDAVYDVLHGRTAFVLNGVHVVQAYRQSGVPLGQDDNNRWSRSSNYYLDLARPSQHRPD